jgi:hypothetical protein
MVAVAACWSRFGHRAIPQLPRAASAEPLAIEPAAIIGRRRAFASRNATARPRYGGVIFAIPLYDDNPTRRAPIVNYLLIGLCIGAFLWQLGHNQHRVLYGYGMIPAVLFGSAHLAPHLHVVPAWATVFTSMFLHGGWFHLIGNILFLWIFGHNVEDELGHQRRHCRRARGLCGAVAARECPCFCLGRNLFPDRQRTRLDIARTVVCDAADQRLAAGFGSAWRGVLGACRRFCRRHGSGRGPASAANGAAPTPAQLVLYQRTAARFCQRAAGTPRLGAARRAILPPARSLAAVVTGRSCQRRKRPPIRLSMCAAPYFKHSWRGPPPNG